jgi:hypothetical protein
MANGARIPSATEIGQLITEWNEWLSARTDALLSLEDRVRSAGTSADQADVAAAFVCRKAITDRLAQVATLAANDRGAASALAGQPLVDDLGGPVGSNLTDAATLLDAVLQRVERSVAGREQQQAGEARSRAQADADLAAAERLAAELGMQANQVAQLREALAAGTDREHVAAEAATVRASLEAAAKERAVLLQRWAAVGGRLETLSATETRVRELAARCREKVVQAPPLAVPSVAAIDLDRSDVSALTWVAARNRITPGLARVDRLEAALAEAERRFRAALDRRDDLRGLLQSFADKASAGGVMELPELDGLYQEAKAVLWAAPCDLVRGGELVDRYVATVNAKMKEGAR